jgi:hypothetical protein
MFEVIKGVTGSCKIQNVGDYNAQKKKDPKNYTGNKRLSNTNSTQKRSELRRVRRFCSTIPDN